MDYDDAYANAPYIKGAEAFLTRWPKAAASWAAHCDAQGLRQASLAYGDSPRQRFDLFRPEGPAQGLMVFVHGGYWLRFDRHDWLHLARGAQALGWAVAIPSYDLCPSVRISAITQQIARAVEAAATHIAGPITLAGHSAGGHLVARMLAPGMLGGTVAKRLRHVMPISPVSDLRPLLQTSMNADLRLDAAEAKAESPALMTTHLPVPVTVWVGGAERPVFLDQARWLADAWQTDHVIASGAHHFDVIEPLQDPRSEMLARLLG